MTAGTTAGRTDGVAALFTPWAMGGLALANRLAVAPMTRVSATADGRATAEMGAYYGAFAAGGFALVLTEGIYTDVAHAQGYLFQPGLTDSAQQHAWQPVVAAVKDQGARVVAQLMHAGALSQGNPHRTGTVGPSAVRPAGQQMGFYRGEGPYPVPAAMTTCEISAAVQGFADAAARAREAGFDGVEIHGANGYLLDQFLTEGTNLRDDAHGGDLPRRLRLMREVVSAVRQAVGPDFAVGLRISQGKVNDFAHRWRGGVEEAAAVFTALGCLPLDYLHTTEFEAWQPACGDGPSLAALARAHGGLPVLANGSLHDPLRAAALLERGDANAVSLGRGALAHADWPRRVRTGKRLATFDRALLAPIADLATAARHRAAGRPHGAQGGA